MKRRISINDRTYTGLILLTFLIVSFLSLLANAVVPAKEAQSLTQEGKAANEKLEKEKAEKGTKALFEYLDFKIPETARNGGCTLSICPNAPYNQAEVSSKLKALGYKLKKYENDFDPLQACLNIDWCEAGKK